MSEAIDQNPDAATAPSAIRTGSVFLRFLWMGSLPFLLLSAFILADRPAWTFGLPDVAYWAIAIAAIVARIVDVVHFGGTTAEGEPATRRDLVRFVGLVALTSVVAWVAVQSVGK
jgi:hypothetical protein